MSSIIIIFILFYQALTSLGFENIYIHLYFTIRFKTVSRNIDDKGSKVLTLYLTSVYLTPKSNKVETNIVSAKIVNDNVELQSTNKGNYHKVLLQSSVKINDTEFTQKFKVANILPIREIY